MDLFQLTHSRSMFCHYSFGGKSLGLRLAHLYRQAQGRACQMSQISHLFHQKELHSLFFFLLVSSSSYFIVLFFFFARSWFSIFYKLLFLLLLLFLFKKWCLFGSKQFSIRSICLDSASTFCILHFFFFFTSASCTVYVP